MILPAMRYKIQLNLESLLMDSIPRSILAGKSGSDSLQSGFLVLYDITARTRLGILLALVLMDCLLTTEQQRLTTSKYPILGPSCGYNGSQVLTWKKPISVASHKTKYRQCLK